MVTLITILLIAGIISGLIQFFVDYKKLPIHETQAESLVGSTSPGWLLLLWNFIKRHWQLFAYLVLGIAGAFLVPLINELTNNGLRGVDKIKTYFDCLSSPHNSQCPPLSNWYMLVLLGYGIVFGYSAVRIIRNIGNLLVGNITKQQQDLQKKLDDALKQIMELTAKLPKDQPAPKPESLSVQMAATDSQLVGNFGDDTSAVDELNADPLSANCPENSPPWDHKPWRTSDSLKALLHQINTLAPGRIKTSDGTIGDIAHQQRNSDHNPWVLDTATNIGVVTAMDITHDAQHKCDCNVLAASLQNNKDERIKYVIWNRQIMNSLPVNDSPAWSWRPYNGANPHNKHIHISVKCDKDNYDSKAEWEIKVS